MEGWEQILTGVAALLLLLFFWPGVKKMVKESPKGSTSDWMSVIIPLAVVVGFVMLLIAML